MIGAPLLMLIADVSTLAFGSFGVLGGIVFWLSFYAFIGVTIGMMRLAGEGRLAVVGALIASFGCLMGTTIIGTDRVFDALIERGIDSVIVSEIAMDPAIFLTSRAPGLAFPIGLFILTFALAKAKVLSRAAASILSIGVLLFPVGRIFAGVAANVVSDVIMLAVLGWLGITILNDKVRRTPVGDQGSQAV